MSFKALRWAVEQEAGCSGAKLVLMVLADFANNESNLAFPSIAALIERCELDRKSAFANLARLEKLGLIEDTGKRRGETHQIKVWRLPVETLPKTEPSQKRNSSEISSNGPKKGTRNQSEPVSESYDSASDARDPVKELFDLGVALLTSTGIAIERARSLIGHWRKDQSDGDVLTALIECRARAISNPVEWITKRFKGARYVSESGFEYRGSLEAIRRKAEQRHDMSTYWQVQHDIDEEAKAHAQVRAGRADCPSSSSETRPGKGE